MINTDHRDLTKLASQLHSEYDRQHYTKVISMAEQLQLRIQELQKIKTPKKFHDDDTTTVITDSNDKYDGELPLNKRTKIRGNRVRRCGREEKE